MPHLTSAQCFNEGCVINYDDGGSVHFIYGSDRLTVGAINPQASRVEPSDYIDFEEHITVQKLSKADLKAAVEHEERKWFHSWHAHVDHKRQKRSKFRMRTYHRWYDRTHTIQDEEVEVLWL